MGEDHLQESPAEVEEAVAQEHVEKQGNDPDTHVEQVSDSTGSGSNGEVPEEARAGAGDGEAVVERSDVSPTDSNPASASAVADEDDEGEGETGDRQQDKEPEQSAADEGNLRDDGTPPSEDVIDDVVATGDQVVVDAVVEAGSIGDEVGNTTSREENVSPGEALEEVSTPEVVAPDEEAPGSEAVEDVDDVPSDEVIVETGEQQAGADQGEDEEENKRTEASPVTLEDDETGVAEETAGSNGEDDAIDDQEIGDEEHDDQEADEASITQEGTNEQADEELVQVLTEEQQHADVTQVQAGEDSSTDQEVRSLENEEPVPGGEQEHAEVSEDQSIAQELQAPEAVDETSEAVIEHDDQEDQSIQDRGVDILPQVDDAAGASIDEAPIETPPETEDLLPESSFDERATEVEDEKQSDTKVEDETPKNEELNEQSGTILVSEGDAGGAEGADERSFVGTSDQSFGESLLLSGDENNLSAEGDKLNVGDREEGSGPVALGDVQASESDVVDELADQTPAEGLDSETKAQAGEVENKTGQDREENSGVHEQEPDPVEETLVEEISREDEANAGAQDGAGVEVEVEENITQASEEPETQPDASSIDTQDQGVAKEVSFATAEEVENEVHSTSAIQEVSPIGEAEIETGEDAHEEPEDASWQIDSVDRGDEQKQDISTGNQVENVDELEEPADVNEKTGAQGREVAVETGVDEQETIAKQDAEPKVDDEGDPNGEEKHGESNGSEVEAVENKPTESNDDPENNEEEVAGAAEMKNSNNSVFEEEQQASGSTLQNEDGESADVKTELQVEGPADGEVAPETAAEVKSEDDQSLKESQVEESIDREVAPENTAAEAEALLLKESGAGVSNENEVRQDESEQIEAEAEPASDEVNVEQTPARTEDETVEAPVLESAGGADHHDSSTEASAAPVDELEAEKTEVSTPEANEVEPEQAGEIAAETPSTEEAVARPEAEETVESEEGFPPRSDADADAGDPAVPTHEEVPPPSEGEAQVVPEAEKRDEQASPPEAEDVVESEAAKADEAVEPKLEEALQPPEAEDVVESDAAEEAPEAEEPVEPKLQEAPPPPEAEGSPADPDLKVVSEPLPVNENEPSIEPEEASDPELHKETISADESASAGAEIVLQVTVQDEPPSEATVETPIEADASTLELSERGLDSAVEAPVEVEPPETPAGEQPGEVEAGTSLEAASEPDATDVAGLNPEKPQEASLDVATDENVEGPAPALSTTDAPEPAKDEVEESSSKEVLEEDIQEASEVPEEPAEQATASEASFPAKEASGKPDEEGESPEHGAEEATQPEPESTVEELPADSKTEEVPKNDGAGDVPAAEEIEVPKLDEETLAEEKPEEVPGTVEAPTVIENNSEGEETLGLNEQDNNRVTSEEEDQREDEAGATGDGSLALQSGDAEVATEEVTFEADEKGAGGASDHVNEQLSGDADASVQAEELHEDVEGVGASVETVEPEAGLDNESGTEAINEEGSVLAGDAGAELKAEETSEASEIFQEAESKRADDALENSEEPPVDEEESTGLNISASTSAESDQVQSGEAFKEVTASNEAGEGDGSDQAEIEDASELGEKLEFPDLEAEVRNKVADIAEKVEHQAEESSLEEAKDEISIEYRSVPAAFQDREAAPPTPVMSSGGSDHEPKLDGEVASYERIEVPVEAEELEVNRQVEEKQSPISLAFNKIVSAAMNLTKATKPSKKKRLRLKKAEELAKLQSVST